MRAQPTEFSPLSHALECRYKHAAHVHLQCALDRKETWLGPLVDEHQIMWTFYVDNGRPRTSLKAYEGGRRALFIEYYDLPPDANGIPYRRLCSELRDGRLDGKTVFYDTDRSRLCQITYRHNAMHGIYVERDQSHACTRVMNFNDDVLHGHYQELDLVTRKARLRYYFESGVQHGHQLDYYHTGELRLVRVFDRGVPRKYWKYSKEGDTLEWGDQNRGFVAVGPCTFVQIR